MSILRGEGIVEVDESWFWEWEAHCVNCSVTLGHFNTKEEAITAWNTRTPVKRVIGRLIDEGVPFPLEDKDVGFAEGLSCAIEIVKEEM